jgi:hypothetical protein
MLVYRRRDPALLPDGWRILDKTEEGVFRCLKHWQELRWDVCEIAPVQLY